jgi:hypothetical protein
MFTYYYWNLWCPYWKKHIQNTADARYGHQCYAPILCTFIKCSHSTVKDPFWKQSMKRYTPDSCARRLWEFWGNVQTQHLFHPLWFNCFCPVMIMCVKIYLWLHEQLYLFGIVTSWNLCQNLLLTFYMAIVQIHSFRCITLTCHFDIKHNVTECLK